MAPKRSRSCSSRLRWLLLVTLVLLADRVVCDGLGGTFDLATAEAVRVIEHAMPSTTASRQEWRDTCQQALDVWHADRASLLDFAEVGETRAIEIFTPARREQQQQPPPPQQWHHQPAPPPSANTIALRWLPQPASPGVCAALDDDRPEPLRRLFVRAAPGAGLTSWLRLLAREARLRGFVPICPAAITRWPELLPQVHGRSVVLLADRRHDALKPPAPTSSGDGVANALLTLTRAGAHVRAVLCRASQSAATPSASRPTLRLGRLPVHALARAVQGDTRSEPTLEALAGRAEGLPGRFAALLLEPAAAAMPIPAATQPADAAAAKQAGGSSPGPGLEPFERAASYLGRVAHPAAAYAPELSSSPFLRDHVSLRPDMSIAIADAWNLFGRQAPVIRDVEALVARGRWAGAVRALRATVAAERRRGSWGAAAVAGLALARLHLTRCEMADADKWCREAGELALRSHDELLAAEALHWAGLVALEQADLEASDRALRMASLAAEQQGHQALRQQIEISLGRCLFWQGSIGQMSAACELADAADANEPLGAGGESGEGVPIAIRAQALRLAARRHLARGELAEAGKALGTAFEVMASFATHEQRDWRGALYADRARLQLATGDVEQCARSIEAALATRPTPARMARIRLVRLEADQLEPSEETRRRVARLMRVFLQSRMPRLLRLRARYWTEPESRRSAELAAFIDRYGETALSGRLAPTHGPVTASHYRALLQMSHETGDERTLLARICAFVRRELGAAYVGLYAASPSHPFLASAGQTRLASPALAARVIATGQFASPAPAADALEAAAPLRVHGQILAALVCRWIIDSTIDRPLTTLLLPAAADAAIPHVQALLDRSASGASPGRRTRDAGAQAPNVRMLGISAQMEALRETIARAADAAFHVLIEGESGSGKELVARALHQQSVRRLRRFCAVNCAALTDELFEAELFGHARGAFTGALTERVGLFEEAHDGTLFLDEVGELSPRAQAKLLRAIQDGEIRRVGENLPRRVQPRIVAATNRALHDEAAAGRFRPDLLYRLDVIRIRVPPLRDRIEDLPVLARAFWEQALPRTGSRATLGPDTLAALARYDWPGNVRELQNVIARLAVQAPARGRLSPHALPAVFHPGAPTPGPAASGGAAFSGSMAHTIPLARARQAFEAQYVRAAIARTGGHLRQAARDLGVSRQGLNKMLARLAIDTND
jgi:DNA-binding NtrC family response regulator